MGLVNELTGGDPGLFRSLSALYAGEPGAREEAGIPPEMLQLIVRTRRAAQVSG
jgi:hypothetical protein